MKLLKRAIYDEIVRVAVDTLKPIEATNGDQWPHFDPWQEPIFYDITKNLYEKIYKKN